MAYNTLQHVADTRYIEGHSRYALSEMVGRGGFATVWRARPVGSSFFVKEDVAIKVIPVYNEGERSRALREGQIAEGLRHRNIVETIEVIPGEHEVYLVTEFVSGLPLDEAGRYYDCAEVTHALAQILEALVYAHGQGIIHRDIKPQNALVDRQGIVKLTDFGVAFRAGDTRLTRVGFAVGTPGYIAPEILDGSDPTALTDIYAVGATARTLLSHQPEEPSPRLREFVDRATSPNPSHRPQSAWQALKLLTGKKAPVTKAMKRNSREVAQPTARYTPRRPERRPKGIVERLPSSLTGNALRVANAGAAAYLGYLLGSTLFINGAEAAGVAVGFGVAGYLLPRLAAIAVIVALAVVLLQGGVVGLGVGVLFPLVGAAWVAGSGAVNRSAARLPLGPLLAVPLSVVNLAAGLPLLLGALMRPLAAGLSAAFGAVVLLMNDILRDGGALPFYGEEFRNMPLGYTPAELLAHMQRILEQYPQILILPVLWAVMAVIVSLGEWTRRPFFGLVVAVASGMVAYPLFVSESGDVATEAVTSLGLAAIMYAALRYLVSRSRG